jgi:ketosteroid isomerase-like protein
MVTNKALLKTANEALEKGDIDAFLSFCTDDTEWVFIGDKTIKGKDAVKQYLEEAYTETTKFKIERMIEEGDFVVQVGEISFENKNGKIESYLASDIWRFENGKMAELKAFVLKK